LESGAHVDINANKSADFVTRANLFCLLPQLPLLDEFPEKDPSVGVDAFARQSGMGGTFREWRVMRNAKEL
jgi:hypothetical protein